VLVVSGYQTGLESLRPGVRWQLFGSVQELILTFAVNGVGGLGRYLLFRGRIYQFVAGVNGQNSF
jgi:hypothetical protein